MKRRLNSITEVVITHNVAKIARLQQELDCLIRERKRIIVEVYRNSPGITMIEMEKFFGLSRQRIKQILMAERAAGRADGLKIGRERDK